MALLDTSSTLSPGTFALGMVPLASEPGALLTVRGTMSDTDIVSSLSNSTFTAHLIAEEPRPEF